MLSELVNESQVGGNHHGDVEELKKEAYLELFHQAWTEQNTAAWAMIYHQYQPLVTRWVYRYGQFRQTDEEAPFFVNEAFARMIQSSARPGRSNTFFNGLGQYLQYLKLCVGSAIEDYLWRKQKDALATAVSLGNGGHLGLTVEAQADQALMVAELKRQVAEVIQDERERLVAEGSWVYGLAPRHIQSKHPEIFTTVSEASQVKRNLVKRLKRRLQWAT
ncbi:hypothetical protein ACFLXQ_05890 [Chloroflexota bacterium]